MHWYTATGEAAHTQLTAKGAKNPTRPTTIRDAKKLQLLPSITGILGVVANPALDRWRMSKVAEYCWKVPPIGNEPVDDYCRNVLEKALEEVGDADRKIVIRWKQSRALGDDPVPVVVGVTCER